MGCEYCEKSNYGETECTASLKYRKNFCEVYFPGEIPAGKSGSNLTPKKKKRKNVKHGR